jgi:hypothetical protein
MLTHVVMFKLKEGSEANITEVVKKLASLA